MGRVWVWSYSSFEWEASHIWETLQRERVFLTCLSTCHTRNTRDLCNPHKYNLTCLKLRLLLFAWNLWSCEWFVTDQYTPTTQSCSFFKLKKGLAKRKVMWGVTWLCFMQKGVAWASDKWDCIYVGCTSRECCVCDMLRAISHGVSHDFRHVTHEWGMSHLNKMQVTFRHTSIHTYHTVMFCLQVGNRSWRKPKPLNPFSSHMFF